MARVDYDKQSEVYDRGRTLPPVTIQIWMVTALRHVGKAKHILDLGSGTGRFSAALAEAFSADVVAVEPSAGMREQARMKHDPRVRVIAGAAESLPLPDQSCDLAWLSNVIHHFEDIPAAARELRRVVASGAPVLIRGAFGNVAVPSLYRFFPGAQHARRHDARASDRRGVRAGTCDARSRSPHQARAGVRPPRTPGDPLMRSP